MYILYIHIHHTYMYVFIISMRYPGSVGGCSLPCGVGGVGGMEGVAAAYQGSIW